jgi:hypothetical protein
LEVRPHDGVDNDAQAAILPYKSELDFCADLPYTCLITWDREAGHVQATSWSPLAKSSKGKSNMSRFLRMQFLALVLFSTPVLLAQGTGSITGTVRDNTGAVVPKAEVALTDTGTLNSLHSTTNTEGEYLFAAVPPGTYDLAINAVGFAKYESKGSSCALPSGRVSMPL